jgi:hypothetical protein
LIPNGSFYLFARLLDAFERVKGPYVAGTMANALDGESKNEGNDSLQMGNVLRRPIPAATEWKQLKAGTPRAYLVDD